jgi:predicted component of type VI protein secretion system
MLPRLVAIGNGSNIVLDKPIVLIGRHPECDIQIDSRKISRRHCCIAQVSDYLVVRDLGSTNGVRINGVRVAEGALHDADELIIGNQPFRVACDDSELPQESTPHPGEKIKEKRVAAGAEPVLDAIIVESGALPVPLAEPGPRRTPMSPRVNSRKPKPSSSTR